MSKKFVRNITNTKIKGDKKEPLYTNTQNDLLSDGEDVAVRNNNEYHILTDNIKNLIAGNDFIRIERTDKNTITVYGSDVDLSDYAKKDYVDQQIESIEVDLSDYLTIGDAEDTYQTITVFDTAMQEIYEELGDKATIEYVDGQISAINAQLEDYYTKEEVNTIIEGLDFVKKITVSAPLITQIVDGEIFLVLDTIQNEMFFTHQFLDDSLTIRFRNAGLRSSEGYEFSFYLFKHDVGNGVVNCDINGNNFHDVTYTFDNEDEYNLNKNRSIIKYRIVNASKMITLNGVSEMKPS